MWHWNQDVFQHPGWWCGGGIQNNFARNSKEWLEWVEWDLVLDNRGRCHRVVTKSFLECAIYCHYTCYIILTFNFLHAAYPLFDIDLEVSWLRGRISSGYCKEFHSLGAKGRRTRRPWALSESTTLSCFFLQFFPMQNGTPIFVCPQYYCTEGTQKQLCTALVYACWIRKNAHYSTYLFRLFIGEFENLISHFPTPLLSARTCSARLSFALASWAKNVIQKMLYKKCYTKML